MSPPDDIPICTTVSDIEDVDGETAAVIGTYTQIDMSQRPRGEPVYRGHVGVELEDDTSTVFLGPTWSSDSQRDEDEIERLEGARVRAVGTVHRDMPEPPQEVAYIMGPCLDPVDSAETVE